ncbi:MAG TPA: DUF1016 N-terminal domain-containing protein [Rubrivivax sp.]|nr:DUF1016 N-terminal domain-containing protein [Rubrivivax sp.]
MGTGKAIAMSSKVPAKRGAGAAAGRRGADALLTDLRQLIDQARQAAAVAVSESLPMLYWRIGKRIRDEVLRHRRAGYGEWIVATLSRQLAAEFGCGLEEKNLRRMVPFAEAFPARRGWQIGMSSEIPALGRRRDMVRELSCR